MLEDINVAIEESKARVEFTELPVIIGYATEQKYYPIPYDYKRILFYLFFAVVLYLILKYAVLPMELSLLLNTAIALILLFFYIFSAYFLEKKK